MNNRPNPKDSDETLNNAASDHRALVDGEPLFTDEYFGMSDSEKILKIKDIIDKHGEELTDGECIDEIIEVLNA